MGKGFGSLAGAVLGAAFGSLSGGVTIMVGLGIGQTLGAIFDYATAKPQRFDQGKLSDLRVSGSAYGSDIPRFWGKAKLGGNCVWFDEDASGNHLVKHKKRKRSGKGGGSEVTTYTYTCTLACIFAQASIYFPETGTFSHRNPVLKKLWAGDQLVYDSASGDNIVDPVWHDGSETQSPDSIIMAADGSSSGDTNAFRGYAYLVIEDFQLEDYGNAVPQLTAEIWTDAVDLDDVVSDVLQSRGLDPSEFDVTAGVGVSVASWVCSTRRGAVEDLEGLLLAYDFDLAEIDGKLVLVERGGSSSWTIPEADLGVGDSQRLTQVFEGEADLPGRVDVKFYDLGNQFQQAVATEVRATADITRIDTLEFPLGLTMAQGRNIAARRLDSAWLENRSFTLTVGPKWLKVAPGDAGEVVVDGTTYSVRVLKTALDPGGAVEISAVFRNSESLDQDTVGGDDPGGDTLTTPVDTVWVNWSGRDLVEQHRGKAGFCVAATAAAGWKGATIYYSLDAGLTYIAGPAITGETIFGETVGTLSASGAVADAFDLTNSVEVDVSASVVGGLTFPATTTQDNVRAGDNQALIGDEIVGFATVTPSGTDEHTLEDLLRGQRASTMSGHAAGDLFVWLSDDVVFVELPDSAIGTTVKVKCVSAYQVLGDVTAQDVLIATPRATALDDVKASVLVPYMISPSTAASYAGGSRVPVSWATLDLSGDLEAGTQLVMLQAVLQDSSSGDDGRQALEVRKASGQPTYVVGEYQPDGSDSSCYQTCFVIAPCTSDLEVDYQVLVGFGDGWELRVLGGFKPLA